MTFMIKESIYKLPIEVLELSVRAVHCLKHNGMFTIEDVLDRQSELLNMKACGAKTVKEIKNKIINYQIEQLYGN